MSSFQTFQQLFTKLDKTEILGLYYILRYQLPTNFLAAKPSNGPQGFYFTSIYNDVE